MEDVPSFSGAAFAALFHEAGGTTGEEGEESGRTVKPMKRCFPWERVPACLRSFRAFHARFHQTSWPYRIIPFEWFSFYGMVPSNYGFILPAFCVHLLKKKAGIHKQFFIGL